MCVSERFSGSYRYQAAGEQLKKLNGDESPGGDGIHLRTGEGLQEEVAELLIQICHISQQTAAALGSWRNANVSH